MRPPHDCNACPPHESYRRAGRFLAVHFPALVFAALLLASGCNRQPSVTLDACLFLDNDVIDGKANEGEGLILTFSSPVALGEVAKNRGLLLYPAASVVPSYTVFDASRAPIPISDNQLLVVLGGGANTIHVPGRYGSELDREATGVQLDFDALGLVVGDAYGGGSQPLTGLSAIVDIASLRQDPAHLMSATWRDEDGSLSVSRSDTLTLVWNRRVRLSPGIKSRNTEVPPGMFVLPVAGDRLDDGEQASHIAPGKSPNSLIITLGSRPRLRPLGIYDDRLRESPDAPSGIAIRGTDIRRNLGVLDALSEGVADVEAVDIGGDCDHFEAIDPPQLREVEGIIATGLPRGGVLLTGGWVATRDGQRRVSNKAFLNLIGVPSAPWLEIPLHVARRGHTASYFNGRDGDPGTIDDFIVIFGGWDDNDAPLASLEVLHPYESEPSFTEVHLDDTSAPRSFHTAHALDPWPLRLPEAAGHLLLIGGFGDGRLNGSIEVIKIESDFAAATVTSRQEMDKPRAHHQSALQLSDGILSLFVYGGFGATRTSGPVTSLKSTTIGAPELFTIIERKQALDISALDLDANNRGDDPYDVLLPRFGHRLVSLPEEANAAILLLGGQADNPYFLSRLPVPTTASRDYAKTFRIQIDVQDEAMPIQIIESGSMLQPRSDFATIPLADGDVLILGGTVDGELSTMVERFNPATNYFESFCAGLVEARPNLSATPLSDGEWLIIGDGGGEIVRDPSW